MKIMAHAGGTKLGQNANCASWFPCFLICIYIYQAKLWSGLLPLVQRSYTKAIVNVQNTAATGWQRKKSFKTFCTFIILKYRSYNLSRVLSVTYATCNVDLQNIHCSSLKSEVKKSQSIHFTWKGSPVHYIWTIFKIFTCFRISASKISSHYITCVI